jgi:proteic killer suppression protein
MAVLKAADNCAMVPTQKPERRHELTGKRKGTFAVDLKHPFRLIFKPNHEPVPVKKDGGIDLSKVTAITILGVEDYHS